MKAKILYLSTLLFAFSCQSSQNNEEFVVVGNGIKIPLSACVEANKKLFGKAINPTLFCKCMIPKMYEQYKDDPTQVKLMQEGDWDNLAPKQNSKITEELQACASQSLTSDTTSKLMFSPETKVRMKAQMKARLKGSDIEITNDLDNYCDCVITEMLTNFSAKEIMQKDFNETEKAKKLTTHCLELTKKQ